MGSLIFVLLTAGICFHRVSCNSSTTVNETAFIAKPNESSTTIEDENQPIEREGPLNDFEPVGAKPFSVERSKNMASVKVDSVTKRKSRILGSLAFLAGLGVGGLTGAASSSVKNYARVPQASLMLNLGSSRISPLIAAFYDPHPYVLTGPLGLISLLDASRLQAAPGAAQSDQQNAGQNQFSSQVLSLFDNKRPGDTLDGDEEYVEEGKTENDETSNDPEEETDNRSESALEADRNAEEKVATRTVVCATSKGSHKKQTNFAKESRDRGDLMPASDGLLETTNAQGRNKTRKTHNSKRKTTTTTESSIADTTEQVVISTNSSVMQTNNTDQPPFFGYYGGSPQDINNVDFTTDANTLRYDYGQINYNLPYDRPANFNPDKYNYYPSPQYNPYSPIPYQQEQFPEYFNTDFSRYYTPESQPTFNNGFRPVS